MTDPFVIIEYFDVLKATLNDLGLNGRPSSRTTSSSDRENTTVLPAVSISGGKAPPPIVFKWKIIWDSGLADEKHAFEGSACAASLRAAENEITQDKLLIWIDSDKDCNPEMHEEDNEDQQQEVA
ncbi:hypothetical protein ILUMI_17663 [Ignelater luminosus]|uniref:Uncharacterized protein n=1 Tax=Ignelater luminosus TaxID=2038154 RepID=A0A8K0G1N2_IGNLU|nr:hypothetical protein ILUMI_17663 [Ignelater luminosus]